MSLNPMAFDTPEAFRRAINRKALANGWGTPLGYALHESAKEGDMSDNKEGLAATEAILEHYGVKGMKWGVRKKRTSSRVTVSTNGSARIKTKGGENRKPSSDAMRTARIGQQAKKSGYQSLTNAELKAYIERKGLEKKAQHIDMAGMRAAVDFVEQVLKGHGKKVI